MSDPAPAWQAHQAHNQLPPLPPASDLESKPVLRACISARAALAELKQAAELADVIFEQPYCRIGNLVDKGIARRQAASRYLKELADAGVLREKPVGREKLFIHPKLMQLLTRDSNRFEPYT